MVLSVLILDSTLKDVFVCFVFCCYVLYFRPPFSSVSIDFEKVKLKNRNTSEKQDFIQE